MKPLETLQDLIQEAKIRTVWWAICIFGISYFLSHTSKSMWTNIPISILMLTAFRFLSYEMELRWRVRPIRRQTYLSHLQKKQLSINDPRLSTLPTTPRWKRKIDSPPVEVAINDFINKILQDFMVDLWYSSITPDKEAPELIHVLILDVLGEISGRIKGINLVDLLTRDMVELIGNHLDLYRRNQSDIGVDVMGTLSFEERDERLKRHLMAAKELHPALISPECEYKVLQRFVGGVLAIVLRPREAQCPLVRCFSRELLTCLVMQPVMNLASPGFINELIEYLFLATKDDKSKEVGAERSSKEAGPFNDHSAPVGNTRNSEPESIQNATSSQSNEMMLAKIGGDTSLNVSEHGHSNIFQEDSVHYMHPRPADWARVLEAATERRTQVLAPENLENLWTKGRNYKKKAANLVKAGTSSGPVKTSGIINSNSHAGNAGKGRLMNAHGIMAGTDDKSMVQPMHGLGFNTQIGVVIGNETHVSRNLGRESSLEGGQFADVLEEDARQSAKSNMHQLKRSSSTSALKDQLGIDAAFTDKNGAITSSKELYDPEFSKHKEVPSGRGASELVSHSEGSLHVPKLKCRVIGAFFEKIGSKSFAVYSIAVTDAQNKTWFVKRRYRNFERLHRHLKEIPNYSLHLPPKRFLSSSTDDYFVHQRCILLDKYLQDVLSIANVAEQHEVWDFFSISSKNYSFGKSTSVMKTLAVNVDDAMDDIVRQFKGVSDGLRRKVVGSPSLLQATPPKSERTMSLSWNEEDISKYSPSYSNLETSHSLSDDETHEDVGSTALVNGWHSDNELNSKGFPPRVVKCIKESRSLHSQRSQQSEKFDRISLDKYLAANSLVASGLLDDSAGVPPEWTPPNVSVPLLNLVDKIFQLNRRGWLRRQVFWISKQILQLMMEDAIDDWLLRQIQWLRREDVIAHGIRWVQDVLWPSGTFFMKLESNQGKMDDIQFGQKPVSKASGKAGDKVQRPSSFELQLEAARRASDVKKLILGGAPTALVSLIGYNQYQRCAKDIYYFLQSTVCIKQLAYSMLELLLVSVFPELRDLVLDVHEKPPAQPA